MECRGLRLVDAELDHGHVGIRVDLPEDGPGAMIQSPRIVESHGQGREEFLHAVRKIGISRRRVSHPVEFAGEPSKVMDCAGRGADGNPGAGTNQYPETARMAFRLTVSAPMRSHASVTGD